MSLWAWWEMVAAHHRVHDHACCHCRLTAWSLGEAPATYAPHEYGYLLPFFNLHRLIYLPTDVTPTMRKFSADTCLLGPCVTCDDCEKLAEGMKAERVE